MNLDLDRVPSTLGEAVDILEAGLEPAEREEIRAGRLEAISAHHTIGRWMRNAWSLWDGNTPLCRWFSEAFELGHPDDISGIVLEALVKRVRGGPQDWTFADKVAELKAHWRSLNCDSYGRPIQ